MPKLTGRRFALLALSALAGAALTVSLLGGARGDDTPTATATTSATTAAVPIAPAGPRPRLPAGWRRVRDADAGFTIGVPPGWSARQSDGTLVLRSRDRTLAIAVGADRSAPGRSAAPRQYAEQAIDSLAGYRGLRATRARPVETAPYPGALATARGTYEQTGVEQAITLVALQRRGVGTFTLLAFRSARAPRGPADRVVDRVVDTLHAGRPT
jgi:hypothetical protein